MSAGVLPDTTIKRSPFILYSLTTIDSEHSISSDLNHNVCDYDCRRRPRPRSQSLLCVLMLASVTHSKDYVTFHPAYTRGAWYLSRDLCG